MTAFKHFGFPVKLAKAPHTALMTIRDDYKPEDHTVVFADPQRLAPYIEQHNKPYGAPYLEGKRFYAMEGLQAAKTELTAQTVLTLDDHPVPMAKINCYVLDGKTTVMFTDGVTRSTILIENGAEYVPLQVANEEAALLQQIMGSERRPPEPAVNFVVPRGKAMDARIEWSKKLSAPRGNDLS